MCQGCSVMKPLEGLPGGPPSPPTSRTRSHYSPPFRPVIKTYTLVLAHQLTWLLIFLCLIIRYRTRFHMQIRFAVVAFICSSSPSLERIFKCTVVDVEGAMPSLFPGRGDVILPRLSAPYFSSALSHLHPAGKLVEGGVPPNVPRALEVEDSSVATRTRNPR